MKPLIQKRTVETDSAITTTITIFGIKVYRHRQTFPKEQAMRPIGFVQYPIEAPDWHEGEWAGSEE